MSGSSASVVDEQPPRISWRALFLLFTAAWALRFSYFALDDLTRSESGTIIRRLIEEGTGAYSVLLLFPLIAAMERRFPLSSGRWRNWPWHVLAWVPFTLFHTSLMAVSRWTIFPALGQGPYDYGKMPLRYFMEAPEDFITYASLLCLLTFLRVQHELRSREVRSAMAERDIVSARLEALSLRLQPHFLFNALNTISSTVYDDPVAADEMIGRLGDLLRQSLRASDRQEVSVGEELETLRAYLSFVEARFGDRVHCALDVAPEVLGLAVPVFLLQPLVENAVHHGAAAERDHTDILIMISASGGRLFAVVDNEIAELPPEFRTGTGLGTTRDRLRLLHGDAASLETAVHGDRFRVTVTLPARAATRTIDEKTGNPPVVEHAGAHR